MLQQLITLDAAPAAAGGGMSGILMIVILIAIQLEAAGVHWCAQEDGLEFQYSNYTSDYTFHSPLHD